MPQEIELSTGDDASVPAPLRAIEGVETLLEILNSPVAGLVSVGSKRTVKTAACPGFRVVGKLPPETENPVPDIESELIFTGTLPLEVTVTDLVAAVPNETLPKSSEVVLKLTCGPTAFSSIAKLRVEFSALAVTVAFCDALTAATPAVKEEVEAPEGTITLVGTVTEPLLLDTETLRPPVGAAELNPSVHVVVPAPVNELLPHESWLNEPGFSEFGYSVIKSVFVTPPVAPVIVTVTDWLTAEEMALNPAVDDPF